MIDVPFKGVFGLMLVLAGPAQAEDCNEAGNTVQISACVDGQLRKADLKLNATYQKALAALEGNSKANLVKSERAWIAYKQAQCRGVVADQWEGGSGQGIAIASCELGLTNLRITELEEGPQ